MTLAKGDIFDDRYELLGTLGSGGIGIVYKALQLDCNRVVALKILHGHVATDDEFRTRFMREAQALSRLEQVNIVTVYNLGITNNSTPYMAMEYVQGESLRSLFSIAGRLPVLRALKIIRDAARALAHVHQHGIVHRDLKPENILISNTPELDTVKLVDFGLARVTEISEIAPGDSAQELSEDERSNLQEKQKLTHTGELIGTTAYMSPEQCLGKPVDFRTDIYSLTACFYELITGRKVYEADTPVGFICKHVSSPVPSIKTHQVDRFDPSLNVLIAKGLAKDPADRFGSMSEFADELETLSSRLQGSGQRVDARVKATLAFLACVGIALVFSLIFRPSQPASVQANACAADEQSFLKLAPRSQFKKVVALLRMHALPDSLHSADLCLRQAKLSPADTVSLLFQTAKAAQDEEAVYYRCKLKDTYEKYPANCPRDLVLRGLLEMSSDLYIRGFPRASRDLLQYIENDLKVHGMTESYKGNVMFGLPSVHQVKIWQARLLSDHGEKKKAVEEARKIVSEYLANWSVMMTVCLDLEMKAEAEAIIRRCHDGLSLGGMSAVCRERGEISLAEMCVKKMRDLEDRNAEPETQIDDAENFLEKGEKDKAKKVLLDYMGKELSTSKTRDWLGMYRRYAKVLFMSDSAKAARKLLAKVNSETPISGMSSKKGTDELIEDLRNGSQLARYEASHRLDLDNLTVPERCSLAVELYHYDLPSDESATLHLAEAYHLLDTEAGRSILRRPRIACMQLYQQALICSKMPQEALRVCDRILDELQKYEANDKHWANQFQMHAARCNKIKIWHQLGESKKAEQEMEQIEHELSPVQEPWSALFECELLLHRDKKAIEKIVACKSAQEFRKMARVCYGKYRLDLAEECLNKAGKMPDLTGSYRQILNVESAFLCLEKGQKAEAQKILQSEFEAEIDSLRHDQQDVLDEYHQALSLASMQKQSDELWRRKFFY